MLCATPRPSTIAIPGIDELQFAPTSISVLLSLNVPCAVNCCEVPKAILASEGDTAIEVNVAFVTVTCMAVEADPSVAVIVVCPGVNAVTIPVCHPTVAMLGEEEVQFASVLISCAAPLLILPCMANCTDVFCAICALDDAVVIAICLAEATDSGVVPFTPPTFAVIVACPSPCPVATPDLTVATLVTFDDITLPFVRSCIVPSLNVPVTANDRLAPGAMNELAGVRATESRVAEVTFT